MVIFINSKSKGFTLVELIIIMIIISILAALIVPKFIDLKSIATQKTVDSVASSLTAASAANYQLSRTGSSEVVSVQTCKDVANTLAPAQILPENYNITPDYTIPQNGSRKCTLIYTDPATSVQTTSFFIGYYVSP